MSTHALGLPQKQCLVLVPSDPKGVMWHQRVLLLSSGRADGRWIAALPDHTLEIIDLRATTAVPLSRGERLPQLGPMSTFAPVDAATLDALLIRAQVLAFLFEFGPYDVSPGPASGSAGCRSAAPAPAIYQ